MNHDQPKPTNDVPEAEAKTEGQKLEWGQEIKPMDFGSLKEEIRELNSKLGEDEQKWRLPTKEELLFEFGKTNSTPVGFKSDIYWSDTMSSDSDFVYRVNMSDGQVGFASISYPLIGLNARLVRDVV